MTESNETERKSQLGVDRGRLELRKTVGSGQVRQQFPHGRQKTVQVEIKRKRSISSAAAAKTAADQAAAAAKAATGDGNRLSGDERATRLRALQEAMRDEEIRKRAEIEREERKRERAEAERQAEEETKRQADAALRAKGEESDKKRTGELAEKARKLDAQARQAAAQMAVPDVAGQNILRVQTQASRPAATKPEPEDARARKPARTAAEPPRKPSAGRKGQPRRRSGKLTISQALDGGDGANERIRSLASVRRQREREKQRLADQGYDRQKISREVVVPEAIAVQELANRMAERGADVIKALMKMGVMATITQTIDADMAELLAQEFGHKVKRVSAADVEIGLKRQDDKDERMDPRAPVVTVMGHVDHGKTSLLDAVRKADVAAREAGGITQHIGAYRVTTEGGDKITFIDTPGHAAFTEMRARGANATDIVILVVAADDGIMPQTIEAISHAKTAEVPTIVAINKCDKQDANPGKVRQMLLSHDVQVESLGGEVQDVEVSAISGQGLPELLEAIALQAELLELKANPDRKAEGVIVEAKVEQGRGAVATALIQKGALKVGDIFVAGAEWGKVRAMLDEHGERIETAGPAVPVEVLGLTGAPLAGDDFIVVDNEARAREVTEFRQDKIKQASAVAGARGTVEQIFSRIKEGEADELPIVIKTDVQGSLEAIVASLKKMATDEVKVNVLHAAVGGINESDITLARASGALTVGFNVRANPQARDHAKRDGVEIRYYSVIYELLDDARNLLSGMLAPEFREEQIGFAEIREIFNITKTGKVAGCYVTEGVVRRGSGVRLLRDDVVIHEGKLKTLRRFKEEVKEVANAYECGMAFENYQDIQIGDVIECFEKIEVARRLEA